MPVGFTCDLASVPRWLRWPFAPPWEKSAKSGVFHDMLYRWAMRLGVSRDTADDLFYDSLAAEGVGWLRRRAMYRAVRLGGWRSWNRHRQSLRSEKGVAPPLPVVLPA